MIQIIHTHTYDNYLIKKKNWFELNFILLGIYKRIKLFFFFGYRICEFFSFVIYNRKMGEKIATFLILFLFFHWTNHMFSFVCLHLWMFSLSICPFLSLTNRQIYIYKDGKTFFLWNSNKKKSIINAILVWFGCFVLFCVFFFRHIITSSRKTKNKTIESLRNS